MRDVLAGGILVQTDPTAQPRLLTKVLPRRPAIIGYRRVAVRRPFALAHRVVVQPGQLASPLMVFGYPSIAVH